MRAALLTTILVFTVGAAFAGAQEKILMTTVQGRAAMPHVKKITSNLYTNDVEACVKFWVERLHFEKTLEVKGGGQLAFAALQKGTIELMYGSYASLEADPATAKAYKHGTSTLLIEVEDVNVILAAMKGAPLVSEIHKTFYGSTEFTVTDPAGHLLTFAQFAKQ